MLKTKRISDLPIEKAMKKHGWDALVSPWEYGIQPDTINAEGTSFWVIPSCTAYLRADPVSGLPIKGLEEAMVSRVHNPRTGAAAFILLGAGEPKEIPMCPDLKSFFEELDELQEGYR